MSYDDPRAVNTTAEVKAGTGTPVYKRILDLFEAEGIKTLFGIPDPNFVHMFLEAERRGWTVVAPHHEAAGGFMAEAASRITGKPAVCISTLGPGMANVAPAIQCALVENSPVIFIGGQRARVTEQRVRRGRIQFIKQMPLFENSVKYSASIEYADQTDEIIREGIRQAMSGTPGPVYIEYPSHVILQELDVPAALPPEKYRLVNQGADIDRVREAAELIRAAKNPILLVGHGVHTSRTGAAVKELALKMNCPVVQTSGGTSYIEGIEDRTFQYVFSDASLEVVENSDLVVALGTELGEPVHYGRTRWWAKNDAIRKWIYVEQDASAIGINRPIDVPLVGDLRGVVPQLTREIGEALPPAPGLEAFMRDGQAELDELAKESLTRSDGNGGVPIHTSRFVVEATQAFPKDGILIRDGGATVVFQWTYSQCKPHDVIWNQNFGHIGTGLPYATGAMLADRAATGKSRPGMLISSDSSFLFHVAELETAAREKLPLVCVVGVDNQWGLEVGVYKRTFGQGTEETGTHWSKEVRLDKVAEGFGCHGEYVTRAEDIKPAIARAYASGKAAVVHVAIDPKANSEEMPKYDKFRTWYAEGSQ